MIIEDLSTQNQNYKKNQTTHYILAPSQDRLLASFLDALLHFPILSIIVSSFMYRMRLLSWLTESQNESFYVGLQTAMVVWLSILTLQSIYIKILHYTPGMYILKLRVRSYSDSEISWGQSFLRSLFWQISLLLLGLPLLEIFSHERKRLLHDRVSETEVYTLKNDFFETKPLPVETSAVRLFLIAIGFALLGWVSAFLSWSQKEIESGHMAMSEYVERGKLCDDIDELASRGQVNVSDPEKRLDFAMALFELGQLEATCLLKETDFVFLKHHKIKNKYWSRVLLAAPFSIEQNEYLKKACEQNEIWCDGEFLLKGRTTQVDPEQMIEKYSQNWSRLPLTFQTALLKIFNKIGQTELTLMMIENLQAQGLQSTGLVEEQLKALMRTQRVNEIKEVLRGVRSVVLSKEYLRMVSKLCIQDLDSGCKQHSDVCQSMDQILSQNKDQLSEPSVARVFFKNQFCKNSLVDNLEMLSLVEDRDLQELIQWSFFIFEPQTKLEGLARLRSFVEDEAKPLDLRWDALQILLTKSQFAQDWKLISYFWKQFNLNSDSYLSASQWLLKEATVQNKNEYITEIEKKFIKMPSMKMDLALKNKFADQKRKPAATTQIKNQLRKDVKR